MTDCTAGCSIQGFVLALYLPFPGADRREGSWFRASGVPGDPQSLLQSHVPCQERGQAMRKGEGRRGLQAGSQSAVRSRSLAPHFPGRVRLQSLLLVLMFARLGISSSFSQHKKCNCTVPPTRLSSSPAGADSFPVSCLLQHFVFTFCSFPFPAPEAIQCHTIFPHS